MVCLNVYSLLVTMNIPQSTFDISEDELLELLNTMEDEDLNNEASEEASDEVLARQREYSKKKSTESRQRTKERNLEIQRMAFSQKVIDLNMVMPKEHVQLLISELLAKYNEQIAKNKAYAHKRINDLMRARTPQFVRQVYKRAPHSFKRCPDILYKTSKIYNKEYSLWFSIEGPYFFEQGTESDMLHKCCPKFIKQVDHAIYNIHRYEAEKKQMAVDSALRVANLKKGTYFELLQAKPEWFKILYDILSTRRVKASVTQTYINDLW